MAIILANQLLQHLASPQTPERKAICDPKSEVHSLPVIAPGTTPHEFFIGLLPTATVMSTKIHMTQQQLQRTQLECSRHQSPKAFFRLRSLTPQQRDERSPSKYTGLYRETSA